MALKAFKTRLIQDRMPIRSRQDHGIADTHSVRPALQDQEHQDNVEDKSIGQTRAEHSELQVKSKSVRSLLNLSS